MELNGLMMRSKEKLQQEHTVIIELGSRSINDAHRTIPFLAEKHCLYSNSLSSREMESLTALCDTLLPSIDITSADGSISTFYRSSASMAGTPQRAAGMICERLHHPRKWAMRLALYLLSTWFGTFLFCGLASISGTFPYFKSFSQISQMRREKIMLSWSLSFYHPLRMLFRSMKLLILFLYFSQVDDKNENLTWKAIDYPGPDPAFKPRLNDDFQDCKEDDNAIAAGKEERLFGPLYRGLINLNLSRDIVADSLRLFGFPVSVSCQRNTNLSLDSSCVIKCDAVVVGSGSGGGVAAGVLANAGYKVVVLEKGHYFARNNLSLLEGPSMDQMYLGSGLLGSEDTGVGLLAGSTVGGGSTINWSASINTPRHVINEWSERYDLELFDSKLYEEALDVVCEKMGVQSGIQEEGFNNAVLRRGCEELGYPMNAVPRNSSADHYCGWCGFGCKDGKKKGTCETWLVDLVNSGNGVILPGCEAVRVLNKRSKRKDKKAATGVAFEFEYNGVKDLYVVESKVTIVACGALSTPALLKASGLKNANIGKNLHLHPTTMGWGYFSDDTSNSSAAVWPEKEKKSCEGAIITATSMVVANFHTSGYGAIIETPSLHPGLFASLMPWISGSDIKRRMCRFSRTAHLFAMARDKGSGTANSPTSITYHMAAEDEQNLQSGLEKILRILAAAGAEEIGTHSSMGKVLNVKKASSHEFEKFVKDESARPLRNLSTTICSGHQMGSCRMGVDPKDSVVNQMGETWEVEGLYVADTSVFPTALGVNPMVTVQAISYCIAQSVLQVLRRKKIH